MKIWMLKKSNYFLDNIRGVVSAFSDTVLTKYAKQRNLWVRIIRDSDAAEMDVGYGAVSRAAAITWSAGTDSYFSKRYNEVRGKPDITISNSSDQELAITGDMWVEHTAKYCLFEPSKSSLSVMDVPLSVNARMANKTLASYVIVKDDKPTTLLASKGYANDYVYPIKCSDGLMDFSISGGSGVFWYLFGGTTSTVNRPAVTLGAGVSYMFSTNLTSTVIVQANVTYGTYIGEVLDIPKITGELSISGSRMTGEVSTIQNILVLDISYSSFPACNLNQLSCPMKLNLNGLAMAFGILNPNPDAYFLGLLGTNMSPNDTDQTLINLANITTIVSGGILYIKNNRTATSDAAVASLAGKFTITEV